MPIAILQPTRLQNKVLYPIDTLLPPDIFVVKALCPRAILLLPTVLHLDA